LALVRQSSVALDGRVHRQDHPWGESSDRRAPVRPEARAVNAAIDRASRGRRRRLGHLLSGWSRFALSRRVVVAVHCADCMIDPPERRRREMEWLREEVALAAGLSDAERIAILEDLWATAEAIRATKSPAQIEREELARQTLDGEGLARYAALAARLA
jgi:hypothetical protein